MIHIETPRLLLRDWKESDTEVFREMNADKEVMKYFPKTLTEKETHAFYHKISTEFREHGFGLYAVELKKNGKFIGFTGFHQANFEASFTPCIEIGWRLKKESWGNGYATEGASACLAHGFRSLQFQEVYSFTARINLPSIHVMEKIGLKYVKNFNYPQLENQKLKDHVLYQMDKDTYFSTGKSK